MEKIKSAAIKYRKNGSKEFEYATGYSHSACIDYFSCIGLRSIDRDMGVEVQGFMTTEDRFVNRVEALKIAINANQLQYIPIFRDYLISQDIDWSK